MLSVAAAVRLGNWGLVEEARIVLDAAANAFHLAKPMDNTHLTLHWRKRASRALVGYALRERSGDDLSSTRPRIARQGLLSIS